MATLRILGLALLAALVSSATVPTEDTYTSYRLPTAFRPEHYGLQVLTHLGDEKGFMFSGRVLIRVSHRWTLPEEYSHDLHDSFVDALQ